MDRKMILLVEDNPDDEALTLRALKKNNIGNELKVVRDGAEALEFLFCTDAYADRDPHDIPQVVLLDLKLPKIDGLEVLRRIRQPDPGFLPAPQTPATVPILVISGESHPASRRRFANRGLRKRVLRWRRERRTAWRLSSAA